MHEIDQWITQRDDLLTEQKEVIRRAETEERPLTSLEKQRIQEIRFKRAELKCDITKAKRREAEACERVKRLYLAEHIDR